MSGLKTTHIPAIILWQHFECFACSNTWPPPPLSGTVVSIADVAIISDSRPMLYQFSERALVSAADELGWRMVTLYGMTIYICPKCRERYKLDPPPDERHLPAPQPSAAMPPRWPTCKHERLTQEGICRECGTDQSGSICLLPGGLSPAPGWDYSKAHGPTCNRTLTHTAVCNCPHGLMPHIFQQPAGSFSLALLLDPDHFNARPCVRCGNPPQAAAHASQHIL